MLRGGAGRIIFTPYFLCANILVILFLTVKYWSASNYEFELLNKVHFLEIELKSCKTTSINCGGEFKHKSKNLQTCQEDFQSLQNKYDRLTEALKLKSLELDQLKKNHEDSKSSMENVSQKCMENLEECQASEDKCIQNLKAAESSLLEVKSALENCSMSPHEVSSGGSNGTEMESQKSTSRSETNSLLAEERAHLNETNIVINEDDNLKKDKLPDGELPDVNPEAVHVLSKPVNVSSGMRFHSDDKGRPLPLLPRGDPAAPRPGPRFSVVDPPKEINLTQSSSTTEREPNKLEQMKKLPAPLNPGNAFQDNKLSISLKNTKSKPKNLDAREAENMDYEGEDQDPNGVIEDMEKDTMVLNINNSNNEVI